MRYYIADNHFFHENMLTKMDKRGFSNLEEMHEYMIEKHNKKVRKNDDIVFIGDISMGNAKETEEIIKRLNGNKYLIKGNHDRFLNDKDFDRSLFKWIADYKELNDNNKKVILSHYPNLFYNGQYKKIDGEPKVFHLSGHIHDTQDNIILNDTILKIRNTVITERNGNETTIPCNIINCFCMFSDYEPLTLDEWIENYEKRLKEFQLKRTK